ncbi:MAG: carotenoid biosynthesis protein [Chloroflexota bacterium]
MTHKRVTVLLLAAFAFLMVYGVLAIWFGLPRPGFITGLTTITGFSFALSHAGLRLGWQRALALLAFVFAVSLAFESLGVATGLVYGPYHYTEKLGPKFLGLVPYLIAVAWFMMMYPSYVIADRLTGEKLTGWKRVLWLAALGGLAMTAWDVVMDPLMVNGGNWVWEVNGAYFGVPLQNFWGWWLTVFTTFVLYLLTMGERRKLYDKSFDRLAVLAYVSTGLGNIAVSLLSGLAGPALAGIFAMMPWVLMGWLATRD